ncbi:MAG: hypothetical protein JXR78_06460 [Victivallales bacterium]|nr:hypothetical protein [Victivallales bacterium]
MAKKCNICGSKARRYCPAQKNEICSICCATKRMTEIKCTADCEHNTFGVNAILAFRKLDADSANYIMRYLMDFYSKSQYKLESEAFSNMMKMDDDGKIYYFCREKLYHEIQADGRTIFEIWRDDNFTPLNHDQQLLLEYKRSLTPTVVEFQKSIDENFAEFIDLLEPERPPFLIMDPDFVEYNYPRFTRMLTYIEIYPNFTRFSRGGGLMLNGNNATAFISQLEERAEAIGLPPKEYLRKNYAECCEWINELSEQYRKEILAKSNYRVCKARYDIGENYRRIIENLLSREDMAEDDDPEERQGCRYFVWLRRGSSSDFDTSNETLSESMVDGEDVIFVIGSISLFHDKLELEARSDGKYAFARQRLEQEFGQWLEFQTEVIRDVAQEMMDSDTEEYVDELAARQQYFLDDDEDWDDDDDWDDDEDWDDEENFGIPLEVRQHMFNQTFDRHYHDLINQKIPKIDNMTPKEAAENASMRHALIELMKDHIRSTEEIAKVQGVKSYDLTWLLDELKLPELK